MQVSEFKHIQDPHGKCTQDHPNQRRSISKTAKRTRAENGLLNDLRLAKDSLRLSSRDLTVVCALLSFVHGNRLAGRQPIIVSPSNKALANRADCMPENTLRRHLATLVELGLILRRDSPNGKRYMRGGEGGEIYEVFGFDLSPLLTRKAEFARLAREGQAGEQRRLALRDRVTITRREIRTMIAEGRAKGIPADWLAFAKAFEDLDQRPPRRVALETLEPLVFSLKDLAGQIREALERISSGASGQGGGGLSETPDCRQRGHDHTGLAIPAEPQALGANRD